MKCFHRKRALALCMAAAMMIGSCPVDVLAEENYQAVAEAVVNSTGDEAATGTGESFETPIDITETGTCDVVIPADSSEVYIKYTSAETMKVILSVTRTVEKQYSTCGYLYMYDEQDSENTISYLYYGISGTDTAKKEYTLESGKTYIFKLTVTSYESTDTNFSFSVKKDTLSYNYSTTSVKTEPGATPILEIKGAASSLEDAVITYQWYENDGYNGYTEISGATGASYQLPAITVTSPSYYKCKVSDGNVSKETVFSLRVVTGLSNGTSEMNVYAQSGTQVVLDPKRTSISDSVITYQWSVLNGSSYEEIQNATDATYTFTMSEETVTYRCALYDGYEHAYVTFDVSVPESAGELPLDTDITVESGQSVLYAFTPSKSGFYKKTGWGDAAFYDSDFNEIDKFCSQCKQLYVCRENVLCFSGCGIQSGELSVHTVRGGTASGYGCEGRTLLWTDLEPGWKRCVKIQRKRFD